MDTLYTLCRSADNRHAPPLSAEARAEVMAHKRAFFTEEAAVNPLVAEILRGGTVGLHAPSPAAGRRPADRPVSSRARVAAERASGCAAAYRRTRVPA
jgi:hypothetical protein